jgi:Ca-activated chloride channel family protein
MRIPAARSALVACSLLLWISAATAKKNDEPPLPENLSPAHRAWLSEVALLITEQERAAFLDLERDYQRQSFIRRFWLERDPFPDTRLNEFEEAWRMRTEMARGELGGVEGNRAEVLLLLGPPNRVHSSLCPQLLSHTDFWEYHGDATTHGEFFVVFVRGGTSSPDGYRIWSEFEGIESLLPFGARSGFQDEDALQRIGRACGQAREIRRMLDRSFDRRRIDQLVAERHPEPSKEWVPSFLGRLTNLPEGASVLKVKFALSYPGRRQSRTIVQALLGVPRPADKSEAQDLHYVVDGEILRKGEPFDSFRYRFDFPRAEVLRQQGASQEAPLPLVVQRFLRPGAYTLILRVQELDSDKYFRIERELEVPLVREPLPTEAVAATEPAAPGTVAAEPVPEPAPATEARPEIASTNEPDPFAEANVPAPTITHRVRILPPPRELLLGTTRLEAIASGHEVHKVTFLLNERPVLSKLQPPYSVELNLGHAAKLHFVTAIAFDKAGTELARDKIQLNTGPHRFGVRVVQPQSGKAYLQSLRIEAEVDVPDGDKLDRLELYLGERRMATLYQPPWVQPIRLEEDRGLSYVRAVAFLEDGNSTEDLVFINSPDHLDAVQVDFVELYASVVDRSGQPVQGLDESAFRVLEDGVEQEIHRFELVKNLPLHAGILLDTSTSMVHSLLDAERAALRFFERVVQPRDRAAVIVFNDFPELRVPLTNSHEVLAGGLAGIQAEGETALYDSLIYGLYYFAGIRGKRALIVLSDGADSNSHHNFDETLDFARRSGVAVYTVGIDLDQRDVQARNVLLRVARETGGRSFFISRSSQLEKIYDSIEEELRSQYLIGYQSSQIGGTGFREVEVELLQDNLEAKTIPGYYP